MQLYSSVKSQGTYSFSRDSNTKKKKVLWAESCRKGATLYMNRGSWGVVETRNTVTKTSAPACRLESSQTFEDFTPVSLIIFQQQWYNGIDYYFEFI